MELFRRIVDSLLVELHHGFKQEGSLVLLSLSILVGVLFRLVQIDWTMILVLVLRMIREVIEMMGRRRQ